MKLLDHLEEVADRVPDGRGDAAHLRRRRAPLRRRACRSPACRTALLKLNLSWAQELCIYMFVWMAKFGAAYGVRTGIHVGVDVLINRLPPDTRKLYVLFGLLAGALVHRHRRHARRDVRLGHRAHRLRCRPTSRLPMWIVYLCIPLGSYLMCFRFLQVAWHVLRAPASCRTTTSRTSRASSDVDRRRCRRPAPGAATGRPR